jgi:tRNA acetyltransferase TAN1
MYNYNLLISYRIFWRAQKEIRNIFAKLGDEEPIIHKTVARGILGVKTKLDNREVIAGVKKIYQENPWEIDFALKWVPADNWCNSTFEDMKKVIAKIKDQIKKGETWAMEVEKRRYTEYHTDEIIKSLASEIKEKVNLDNPDKILRVDILGSYAAISVLKPEEIFSIMKP